MNTTEQIKALAELDGWKTIKNDGAAGGFIAINPRGISREKLYATPEQALLQNGTSYLTSYDTIIPLIQKQDGAIKNLVEDFIEATSPSCFWYDATPSQLCEALLRATGSYK
jgi:hypothetical protein